MSTPKIKTPVVDQLPPNIQTRKTNNQDLKKTERIKHFLRPEEHSFTQSQLEQTTILIGGLSPIHNYLVVGALKKLGINAFALPDADKKSSQLGREYGSNGYCNPAYFTTGNLIKYLQKLHSEGIDKQEIIKKYVFLTAGCGDSPCRFGMYESLYRQSLGNAGFEGFRIITFEQSGGMQQEQENLALKFNIEFFLAIVNALNIGDLLNALVFSIRPYEIEKGKTDKVLAETLDYLQDKLKAQKRVKMNNFWKKFFSTIQLESTSNFLHLLWHQLNSKYYLEAMKKVKERFEEIEIDRFLLKPKVKITGEFWATTTRGDGNYKLYPFLEGEGAEVQSDYVATYLSYLLNKGNLKHKNKNSNAIPQWKVKKRFNYYWRYNKKYLSIYLGEKLLKREFNRLRKALGGTLHNLIDFNEMQRLTQPYYHKMLSGGEGYMEVGKNIYYHINHLTHMVLSIKPFGCMPSTLSDGVQVKVIEKYKNMIFLPIETSGDGEINAHSRVQMSLFDARTKAKLEFDEALKKSGKSLEEMRKFVVSNPQLKNPFYLIPHHEKVVGIAANFMLHISDLMNANTSSTSK
ncbi:MAG: putative nucleotide-binding protein (sugar kinase/HSP70/actin superfamily) [Ulvibacter sp.]|jgi:predicted nucleotide-binding protein (sugar kinase/HSP70/actin superfamily)